MSSSRKSLVLLKKSSNIDKYFDVVFVNNDPFNYEQQIKLNGKYYKTEDIDINNVNEAKILNTLCKFYENNCDVQLMNVPSELEINKKNIYCIEGDFKLVTIVHCGTLELFVKKIVGKNKYFIICNAYDLEDELEMILFKIK